MSNSGGSLKLKILGGWQVEAGAVGDVVPIQIRTELAQFMTVTSYDLLR